MSLWKRAVVVVFAVILIACGDDTGGPSAGSVARVDSIQVSANPNNVVSALVQFYGLADSARVLYRITGAAGDSATPAFAVSDTTGAELYALGLFADTGYSFRVVAYRGTTTDTSAAALFGTGELPGDLPVYSASGTSPLPGVTVFSVGNYGVVINNTGRIVWYRAIANGGPGLNFMVLQSGHYVGRPLTGMGVPVKFILYNAVGDSVRAIWCRNDLATRFHDVIVEPDGSHWMMCDDTRTVDMTAYGGSATASVTGTGIQHINAAGDLTLNWSPFDHVAYTDADTMILKSSPINWTHGNGMSVDTDGNLLVSFRTLNEVMKINATTGAVMWRLGGKANQFTFSGVGTPGFMGQHHVRAIGGGQIILLDNVGSADTRFERYTIDPVAHTAVMVQSYASTPPAQTTVGGSVQKEADGRWLVSIGTTGTVHEFTDAGVVTWKIDGNPGYVFRAQKFPSLYAPGVGAPR